MERTTIYLDASLKRRLKKLATARGETEAAIIRASLERYLAGEPASPLRPVGRSTDGGVARRAHEALDELGFGRK